MLPRLKRRKSRKGCVHFALLFLVLAVFLLIQALRSGDSEPTTQFLASTVNFDTSVAIAADGNQMMDGAELERAHSGAESFVRRREADGVDKKNKNDGDGDRSVQDALAIMHDHQPTVCWVCNDGGISAITKAGAIIRLPSELASYMGTESATCAEIEKFVEVDRRVPEGSCDLMMNIPDLRIACGCPNETVPTAPVAASAPAPDPVAAAQVAVVQDGKDENDQTEPEAELEEKETATDVEAPDPTGIDVDVDVDDSPEYNGTMPVKCMDFPPSLKNAHVSPKPSPEELDKWYGNHMRPFTSELDYWDYTIPFLNVTTLAKDPATPFHSGYHNQMMGFTAFFMKVAAAGHGQVLLRTIRHADLFGHKPGIFFQDLFDVKFWNSFYPSLPRFVHCDPNVFTEYNCNSRGWLQEFKKQPCVTNPYRYEPSRTSPWLNFRQYQAYQIRKGPLMDLSPEWPNPVHKAMLKALRIHPDLMSIARTRMSDALGATVNASQEMPSFMTVHARIEPDMIAHNFGCALLDEGRVPLLRDIFSFIEAKWPDPPVSAVFLPMNYASMEDHAKAGRDIIDDGRDRWPVTKLNWETLQLALTSGLWNGRVKVFVLGTEALKGTQYEQTRRIAGAAMDFELAKTADIFVGTPISSWSVGAAIDRFYAGEFENYRFNDTGLHLWTSETDTDPPAFHCCASVPGKCAG